MRQKMVNLVELAHVVDLLGRYASRSIIDKALLSAGLDRTILTGASGFIPYAAEAVLVESVARAINDRHLGARVGKDFEYSAYGAYSHYVLGAPNLASALDRGGRALRLIQPGSEIVIRETETHLVVGRDSKGLSVVGHHHLDEAALFVIGHVVRHYLGPAWLPDWVEVPDRNGNEVVELGKIVGSAIRTGAQMPAIAIEKGVLAALNPSPPAPEQTISLDELGALMCVKPAQTMEGAVIEVLHIISANGLASEGDVARLLAIGPRTLQRALKAESTSFRSLQSQFIESRARFLLSETSKPISELAKTLGYSEPKSFRRAFKVWTGLSPSAFRSAYRTQ
ncbi:helix-turn-helix protein [Pelagimonas varians]|uniref:DNA-binding transcriptional regulator AraC n=2 Tax=Pelagimonas varians TaxID=696760 RepID=A0A238K0P2_9RHOB|nr:helix-turn-helix protein [Pelagimonas varians]SMX35944.1 DNA-binding transcriptional regulator AraC [Pelagimonas varians]